MPERILLVLDRRPGWPGLAGWTLALARRLGARVIAAGLLDTDAIPEGPQQESLVSELEEQAWKLLYEVEDRAFQQDVKISLLVDQGAPIDRLVELVTSYEVQLVVLTPGGPLDPAAVLERCPAPVVFVPEPKEG